mmetsp:Transcript_93561/g.227307  ORF Transcript_93561/g.227307 Transcript_93561/m.227307 type:complete len:629 (+) Transcript_93561:148-2034(+)
MPCRLRPALVLALCCCSAADLECGGGEGSAAGECDATAALQVHSRQAAQAPAWQAVQEESEGACPVPYTTNKKPGGGSFVVYNFTLVFDSYRSYWRRFGVDLPSLQARKRCPKEGCPILVDFPGSGDTVYTQRAWTRWFEYQDEAPQPYILVTMEGSPDAVAKPGTAKGDVLPCDNNTEPKVCRTEYLSQGATSWNVLGWGTSTDHIETDGEELTPSEETEDWEQDIMERRTHGWHYYRDEDFPADDMANKAASGASWLAALAYDGPAAGRGAADVCERKPRAGCFQPATYRYNAYPCFGTHLAKNPRACRNVNARQRTRQITWKNCSSASGANDWDYVHKVLDFVAGRANCAGLRGNMNRIYLSGQSMGGMASIQFAVPQPGNKYNLGKYRPKAIVACSPGGSRVNTANLQGKVPTMVMQGYKDDIAPGSVWIGYNRSDPYYVKSSWLVRSNLFLALAQNDTLVQNALNLSGKNRNVPLTGQTGLRASILLNADTQSGGALLRAQTEALARRGHIGCQSSFDGSTMGIGGDSYLWEVFGTTVGRIAGKPFDMTRLNYQKPGGKFAKKAEDIDLTCANVTRVAGTTAEVKACTFKDSHTYPWIDRSDSDVRTFHQFVWDSWFKGGTRV